MMTDSKPPKVTITLMMKRWPRRLWELARAKAALRGMTAKAWLEEVVRKAVEEK